MRAGRIRFAAGGLVLAVFSAGFFSAAGLLGPLHRLLVHLQLTPALLRLTAGGAAAAAGAALIIILILASGLLFSRVYCGLLCPAGLLQDLVGRLRKRKYRRQPWLGHIHYTVTVLTAGAAAAGLMILLTLIEPYALFGRIMRDLIQPVASGAVNLAGLFLLAFGIYLPSWPLELHPGAAAVTGVLALLLAASVLLKGRIFCNTLCPVGGVLRLTAAKSLFGVRLSAESCISCGACEAVCPAGCIDLTNKSVDTGRCVMCLDCLGICPVNALDYRLRPVPGKKRAEGKNGISRRGFIQLITAAAAGLLAGCETGAPPARSLEDASLPRAASPPGSVSVGRFSSSCIACHLCVSRCPTGVLQPGLFDYGFNYGLKGVNQPVMDFSAGFCEYDCVDCSQVCPTGAILPLETSKKKRVQIGEALFIRERCIVITNGTACGACAEVCPTGAVRMVPYEGLLTIPRTTPEVCIGCGHCENVCPSLPQLAIVVSGRELHGTALAALPKEETDEAARELKVESERGEEDFPF